MFAFLFIAIVVTFVAASVGLGFLFNRIAREAGTHGEIVQP